jgi:hypothetical protein
MEKPFKFLEFDSQPPLVEISLDAEFVNLYL